MNIRDDPAAQQAERQFQDCHRECHAIAFLLLSSLQQAPEAETLPEAEQTLMILVQRAYCWVDALIPLNQVHFFQTHSAACRALLEIAIDVALLTHDPSLSAKMKAYEESARLRAANKYRDFVDKHDLPEHWKNDRYKYSEQKGENIKKLRELFWNTDKHPANWFGTHSLPELCREADKRTGSDYEEFCVRHYDQLCWAVHGSGILLIRSFPAPHIPELAATAVAGANLLACDIHQHAFTQKLQALPKH